MKKSKRIINLSVLVLAFCRLAAQTTDDLIYSGNEQFRKEQFAAAEAQYRKALQQSSASAAAKYNLAVSLYRQQKMDSSLAGFSFLTLPDQEKDTRSKAFYNIGVIYSEQDKLEQSIEAYKNALRIHPDDQQARENLQKALLEWKKRNPPKKEEKKKPRQQPPKQPPRSRLNPKQTQQKLKELEEKEKQAQRRINKKTEAAGNVLRDW